MDYIPNNYIKWLRLMRQLMDTDTLMTAGLKLMVWWSRILLVHCSTGPHMLYQHRVMDNNTASTTRRFSNHVSRLLSRSHTFAIIVILDLKIHHSMWIHWPFFPKTWTKGHWPLDDLWPHVCWGHMCDSTQGSLCPSPMTIHQCMWIQWSILQNTTYIHIHTTYYILHTEWVIT